MVTRPTISQMLMRMAPIRTNIGVRIRYTSIPNTGIKHTPTTCSRVSTGQMTCKCAAHRMPNHRLSSPERTERCAFNITLFTTGHSLNCIFQLMIFSSQMIRPVIPMKLRSRIKQTHSNHVAQIILFQSVQIRIFRIFSCVRIIITIGLIIISEAHIQPTKENPTNTLRICRNIQLIMDNIRLIINHNSVQIAAKMTGPCAFQTFCRIMSCYTNLSRSHSRAIITVIPVHGMPTRTGDLSTLRRRNRNRNRIYLYLMVPLNPKNVEVIITITLFVRLSMRKFETAQLRSTIGGIKNALRRRHHIILLTICTGNRPCNRLQRERRQIDRIAIAKTATINRMGSNIDSSKFTICFCRINRLLIQIHINDQMTIPAAARSKIICNCGLVIHITLIHTSDIDTPLTIEFGVCHIIQCIRVICRNFSQHIRETRGLFHQLIELILNRNIQQARHFITGRTILHCTDRMEREITVSILVRTSIFSSQMH